MTLRPSFGLRLATILLAGFALSACGGQPNDESAGDGDAGDGDGGTGSETGGGGGSGDGDGDPTDTDCPLGTFDCPCLGDGTCDPGLTCGGDGLCSLGGDPGDPTTTTTTGGETTTGGSSGNPYDPEECEAPSKILTVEMLDGSFCSAPCIEDSECPDGPPGTDSLCTISTNGQEPDYCALVCKPANDTCPEGSTCEEIPQQPGFGICTF